MADSGDEFDRVPDRVPGFDGVFLGYLIICVALAIFFLLYFNRLFGSLLSWGIRTWSWHRYRVYIDIEALQISLLGGRIFFTGLRYHGNNQTFHVQHGYVTWRYWIWRVRDADIKTSRKQDKHKEGEERSSQRQVKKELPCRTTVTLAGLEWFVYNRSPVYDGILAGLVDELPDNSSAATGSFREATSGLRNRGSGVPETTSDSQNGVGANEKESAFSSRVPGLDKLNWLPRRTFTGRSSSTSDVANATPCDSDAPLPVLLQMFPIFVTCQKAALVMGNDNTKAILIIKAESLSGEVDASATTTPDPYRQVFNIKFQHPVVEMKENEDFKEDQALRASKEKQVDSPPNHKFSFIKHRRRKLLGGLRNLVPQWRKSVESFHVDSSATRTHVMAAPQIPNDNHWRGLSRYLNDNDRDSKTLWANVEYAAVSTLIDSPEASLAVFWDAPGKVAVDAASDWASSNSTSNINGDDPPAWGMNLTIKGGSANYGPWADRQRADIQRVFFPGLSKDAIPANPLSPGKDRVSTQFKLYVELEEELTLRIPFKEDSKNWRWKNKEPSAKPQQRDQRTRKQRARAKKRSKGDATELRPAGWLDFKIAANATVSYSMDTMAGPNGYGISLNLDLPGTELSSSVNHELLWRSGAQRITCDMSTPLKWNGLRTWSFDIMADSMELFLLRDHVFLLIDLVDDWASGPPPEYLVFTPFRYLLNLDLRNLKLYLNVNDGNIINKPTDFDDNTYLVASCPALVSSVCIPIDNFRPHKNCVSFDCKAETFAFSLHVPPWNTQASFTTSKDFGQGENLVVEGSYTYNAITSPSNTDTLTLNVSGQSPTATLHGFIIRYFLKLKDNYFGDDVHFKTLDEYRDTLRLKEIDPDAERASKPPWKSSNDLDVILNIRVDDPRIMLPSNLYSSKRHVAIETAGLAVDLRFTNYYMDLDLTVNPLSVSLESGHSGLQTPISATSGTQLFIDGLGIFGHRLFGLPPTEPTYLCNWDLSVGAVSGECTAEFLAALARAGQVFGFEFDDDENALIPYSSIIVHDVTFLRVSVQSVKLWLHVDDAAFLLSTEGVDIKFNDWARTHYSKRADIRVPDLRLSCVNAENAARQRSKGQVDLDTELVIKTSVRVAIIGRKYRFSEERKLQQDLVRREDQRTHRTEFLLLPGSLGDFVPDAVDPPAQGAPPVPHPADFESDNENCNFERSSVRSERIQSLRRKSSFLSSSNNATSSTNTSSKSGCSGTYSHSLLHQSSYASLRAGRTLGPVGSFAKGHRDVSVSTGHQSGAHPLFADHPQLDQHSSMAFSSQFYPPHFPLEHAHPRTVGPRLPSEPGDDPDEDLRPVDFSLDDIDPEALSEDHAQSSSIVELPDGITVCFTPTSIRYISNLIAAFQPSDPDDILDSLQTSSVSEVLDHQKAAQISGQIKDVLLKIPKASIRFLNPGTDNPEPNQEGEDQYDVILSQLVLSTRSTTMHSSQDAADTSHSEQERLSLMLRLGSAQLSASERLARMNGTQAAVVAQVDRVMLSLGSKDVRYVDGDIGTISGRAASDKIEYLASLVHRTGVVVSDLNHLLEGTFVRQNRRVKQFTYRLLREGQHAPDPTFLVRPSAVLRSAHQHPRTFDAWKVSIRLRQIWSTLSHAAREQLILDCMDGSLTLEPDIRRKAVEAFEQWRGWDLENVDDSLLVNKVFGKISPIGKEETSTLPLLAAIRLSEVEVLLDPGPRQNKISMTDLTLRLEKRFISDDKTVVDGVRQGQELATINFYCNEAAINVNWELCELADNILKLHHRSPQQSRSSQKQGSDLGPPTVTTAPVYHVVATLGRGAVDVESINLSGQTLAHNLKASFLMDAGGPKTSSLNFILGGDAVSSKLQNHSEILGIFQLRKPSVYISHELQELDAMSCHTIKTTASSQLLALDVKQDPIYLLEVADVLVKDELTQLNQLRARIQPESKSALHDERITQQLSSFRINVAMFLDGYSISIPLLQSLTYNISGEVARASLAANFGQELIFDFDIKENAHEIQINVKDEPRSISLLQIPPTNGRVTSRMGSAEHSVTIFASVELIQFDASAVYSLLQAINRPQISSALVEIQEQVQALQVHMNEAFGLETRPDNEYNESSTRSSKLVYTVHVTLAGLAVFGKTPLKSGRNHLAYLLFNLDRVRLEVANRHEQNGPVLEQPELHINLRQILFDIQRGSEGAMSSCGNIALGAFISASTRLSEQGIEERSFHFASDGLDIRLSPETISTLMEVLGYMGDKIKDLDTSRELKYIRKIRQSRPRIAVNDDQPAEDQDFIDSFLSSVVYQFEIRDTQICWCVGESIQVPWTDKEDLVLSIELISLGTRQTGSARLSIENFQLQMVPYGHDPKARSFHSALLPEVVFNIAYLSTSTTRRFAFQAVGKSLDLRLTSGLIIPAAHLGESIELSIRNVREASEIWSVKEGSMNTPQTERGELATEIPPSSSPPSILGTKRIESLLVDADFAGAVVQILGKKSISTSRGPSKPMRQSTAGKYGQFNPDESGSGTVLRSPGLAWKMEYRDNGEEDPSLYGEIKIDASSNTLYPSIVPLVMEMTSSIKEVVSEKSKQNPAPPQPPASELGKSKASNEDNLLTADPNAVLGRLKVNLGLRICRQQFSLSCQPIARVAATACFDDIYLTANTVRSTEQGNFFAISGAFTNLQASVQHVYSRESTASFELDSIVLSFMNSKHVSGTNGVSAILKVSPMIMSINAKQLQDFLLFREIWYPEELRQAATIPLSSSDVEVAQGHLVQRYQQVAATAAFPWTATISIESLDVSLDMGQAIGKSVFAINDFWVSSKKTSDWEQNLCLGFDKVGIDCTGRLSGFVSLQSFQLRTSIQWPHREAALNETPLIQASIGFSQFRVKAAFDYQAFLVADITSVEFLMYNVRRQLEGSGDRLVAVLDGEAVQAFGITSSASQGIALYQAVQKLIQERRANFETSLKEIEKFMRRRSHTMVTSPQVPSVPKPSEEPGQAKAPISLDTDVVVTLKALNLGVFPNTFSDHQVFKMEALNAQARFAASMENQRVHSILDLTLGQLRIGLAGVRTAEAPRTLNEISVEDVVARATGSRGGTILKVPRVEAIMQTWQTADSNRIEYTFKSSFEGKVEVGWNYSRISYIRGMYAKHAKALEQTWGRELPLTAIRVTGVPEAKGEEGRNDGTGGLGSQDGSGRATEQQQQQQKITAEVNVPLSKYDYTALEPAIIETPQLRDMGEATPPLEWIGLHRERLPNLTHQIVIVSLLELAGEVEDAYGRIMGSS